MLLKKYIVTSSNVKNGHSSIQWLIGLLSASMFVVYGFQIAWVSPMKKILESDVSPIGFTLTKMEMSIVTTMPVLVATIATPLHLYIAEAWGRKPAILIMMAMNLLSWTLMLTALNAAVLVVARILSGISLGGTYCLLPMYLREISHDSIRGTLVSLSISSQHAGVLAMYAMGSYLGYYKTLWIVLSITLAILVLMIFAPESPVHSVKKGQFDVATRNVATLRGLKANDIIVQNEIDHMKNEDSYSKSMENVTLISIFKNKAWRRGYILCQTLFICVAFQGTFGIITYASSILTEAGVTLSADLLSLTVPVLMMLSAVVPIMCVEKMGRKPLLAGTLLLSVVSLGGLASALLAQRCGNAVPGWMYVTAIAGTVSAYSAGVMPIANVIMNDVFKFQIRAKLIGCVQVFIWAFIFVQVILFDLVSSALGLHTVFFVFAGVNLFGAVVVLVFVPETRGLTTDQIEAILAGEENKPTVGDGSHL